METASFVLAVFPLLITTVEHWDTCIRTTKSLFRWETELRKTGLALSHQRLKFQINLEALLTPIVESKADIDTMINDPSSDLWRGETAAHLSNTLGRASTHYLGIVKDCERILKELAAAFDCAVQNDDWRHGAIEKAFAETLQKTGTFKKVKTSVKLLYRKRSVIQLIEELEKNNQFLSEVGNTTEKIKLAEEAHPKKLRGFLRQFSSGRDAALVLHEALAKHIPCSMDGHISHNINLELLDPYCQLRPKGASESLDVKSCFKILFMAHNHMLVNEIGVLQLELTSANEALVSVETAGSTGSITGPNTISSGLAVQQHNPAKKKTKSASVSFNLPPNNAKIASIGSKCRAVLTEVRNLCASAILSDRNFCLDLRVLQKSLILLHNLDSQEKSSLNQFEKVVSLHDLIRMQHSQTSRMYIEKKRGIALRIAASLLHLHSSPWLNEALWSSRVIVFGVGKNGFISDPFLSKPFIYSTTAPIDGPYESETENAGRGRLRHKKPILLALGILLMELGLGKPFETFASLPDSYDPNDKSNLYRAAVDVLNGPEYEGAVSPNYFWATEACINVAFKVRCRDFGDPEFQSEYCKEVIKPLLSEYCYYSGKRSFLEVG